MLAHLAARRLRPLLDRTYPLAEAVQAQRDFVAKGFFGNLVLLPR